MVKLLRMKNLNLFLALALLALMYKTPLFLMDIANNIIGRSILVISLAFIVIRCEFSCAILFSLIIIVLLHNSVEGFIEGTGNEAAEAEDAKEEAAEANDKVDRLEAEADDAAATAATAEEVEAKEAEKNVLEVANDAQDIADAQDIDDAQGFANQPETFIGGFLKKNLNKARKVLRSNITDLDRELKAGAERRSISATKQ